MRSPARLVRVWHSLTLLLLTLWSTGSAYAAPITLTCGSLQGSIIFAEPFQSTSGGCSAGSFTGTLIELNERIVTAQVSFSKTALNHVHDVQGIGSGTNRLVSTQASSAFTVTPETESLRLLTSSSPSYEETFVQLQGLSARRRLLRYRTLI